MDQIFTQLFVTSPVAAVLLIVYLLQRSDARRESDRHAAEEAKWRDEYLGLALKVIALAKGDSHGQDGSGSQQG